jgi:cytoskeleton protein RodZ
MSEDLSSSVAPVSPGALLKQTREVKQLSTAEIALRLRLKVTVIEALEADDFTQALSPTFVKGYLRSYAKLLELDPNEIIGYYQMAFGEEDMRPKRMQSFSRKLSRDNIDSRWRYVTYTIVAVVAVLVAIYAYQHSQKTLVIAQEDTAQQTIIEPIASTSLGMPAEQATPLEQQQTAASKGGDAPSLVAQNIPNEDVDASDDATIVKVEPTSDEAELPVYPATTQAGINDVLTALESADPDANVIITDQVDAASTLNDAVQNTLPNLATPSDPITNDTSRANTMAAVELVFRFEDDCWIKITDGTGDDIAYGVKKAGRVMPVSGQPPFSVILGAPKGVSITYNGESVDISQYPINATARFTLPLQEAM